MQSRRLILTALLLASGCAVGPDYKPPSLWSPGSWLAFGEPASTSTAPARIKSRAKPKLMSVAVEAPPDPRWWDQFHDAELTALEGRVARSNLDVRLATIRLAESRAQLRVAAAAYYPTLSGSAAYKRDQYSSKEIGRGLQDAVSSLGSGSSLLGSSNVNGVRQEAASLKIPSLDTWQDGIDASWELDLWGRVRRSVEAADASLRASEEDRRSTVISTFAEVARDYMTLRGQQTQLAILRDNLRVAQQSLDLTRARFGGGLTTELDVDNALSQLDSVASQIPDSEQQIALQINALGLLLGEPPRALQAELATARPIPPVPPTVPIGVPSELARRRPDIRQAEASLHQATAQVGVAVANFYPKVTLSGSLGFDALSLRDLGFWSASTYSFGPSISLPIFQGGQLRGQLQLSQAQQQQAAVNYQKTVLQAWQDVDNALTAYASEQRKHDALERSQQVARRSLDLATQQYAHGLQSFLNVLNAEQTLFNARSQLASSTASISSDLVQLYNALGGGWETDFPEARKAAEAGAARGTPERKSSGAAFSG